MATPSFDELLAQARQIGESRAKEKDFNRSELIARSVSDFATKTFLTPSGERKEYIGSVSPEGTYKSFDKPKTTGLTLFEKMLGKKGFEDSDVPKGFFPVEQKQLADKALANIFKPKAKSGLDSPALELGYSEDFIKTEFPDMDEEQILTVSGRELSQRLQSKRALSKEGAISGRFNERIIKSYQDSYQNDPQRKRLEEQGISTNIMDGLINLAREGNQVAFAGASTKTAKAMGEVGMLSESDVTRYTKAGSLVRGTADKLRKMIAGTPTDLTLDDIQQIAFVMKDAFEKENIRIENSHINKMSGNLKIDKNEARKLLGFSEVNENKEGKKDEFKIGEIKTNSKGQKGKYLGNGKWEIEQ